MWNSPFMTWYLQVTQSKIFALHSVHLTHSISPTTFSEAIAVHKTSWIWLLILLQAVWFTQWGTGKIDAYDNFKLGLISPGLVAAHFQAWVSWGCNFVQAAAIAAQQPSPEMHSPGRAQNGGEHQSLHPGLCCRAAELHLIPADHCLLPPHTLAHTWSFLLFSADLLHFSKGREVTQKLGNLPVPKLLWQLSMQLKCRGWVIQEGMEVQRGSVSAGMVLSLELSLITSSLRGIGGVPLFNHSQVYILTYLKTNETLLDHFISAGPMVKDVVAIFRGLQAKRNWGSTEI